VAEKRVTLDDVARLAGVSRATASRAISGAGPVSESVRQRVAQIANEIGFSPNQAARALASSRAHAVALVIPEPNSLVFGDPFLGGLITGVFEVFHDTDYQLVLVIMRPDEAPIKAGRFLQASYVDGAIVVSHHSHNRPELAEEQQPIPMVYVGRPWHMKTTMFVDVDNVRGGQLATQRLIDRGARQIACIAGPADMTPVCDRVEGWQAALKQAGLEPGPLAHGEFTRHGGAEAMTKLLAMSDSIDAVFAQSDLMAAGAIEVLQAGGYSVGDDLLIISMDDSEVARTTMPRLSSVTNPAAELAYRASRMLLRVIDDNVLPVDIRPEMLEPKLVLRESA